MSQSPLLVHPSQKDAENRVLHITPENAGWTYVGFDVFDLVDGQSLRRETGDTEVCLVLMSGKAVIAAGGQDFGTLGERSNVFEGLPWSVYVPAHSSWQVSAVGACELAVCAAPATGKLQARLIPPEDVAQEQRGRGSISGMSATSCPTRAPCRKPARGRGNHTARQLVELSAAQA